MSTVLHRFVPFVLAVGLVVATSCGGEAATPVEQARAVVTDLADGKYWEVRALFHEGLADALSLKQLEQDWEGFVELKGAYRSLKGTEVTERGEITVVDVDLEMEGDPGVIRVSFDAEGKIAGLFLLATDIPVP